MGSHSSVLDGVVLRWKPYLSATWSTANWVVTFAQNYCHSYRDGNDLNNNPHRVPAQSTSLNTIRTAASST